jgi:hypothetical protein
MERTYSFVTLFFSTQQVIRGAAFSSVKRATYSVALKTERILEGNLCFLIGSLFLYY